MNHPNGYAGGILYAMLTNLTAGVALCHFCGTSLSLETGGQSKGQKEHYLFRTDYVDNDLSEMFVCKFFFF